MLVLLVSVIFYVILMATFDASKMNSINNLWEDATVLAANGPTEYPDLLQTLANVRNFIKEKSRSFPCMYRRLELGEDMGEAAVKMLKLSCGL